MITAIDPGTHESAVVTFDGERIILAEILPNGLMLERLANEEFEGEFAIELIACYGMPVGKETFETCYLIGRMMEIIEDFGNWQGVYRKDIKMHLCGSMRAKDANIRQALIDKHGEPGTKGNPGKLYGIKSHLWAALAVADYALSTPAGKGERP